MQLGVRADLLHEVNRVFRDKFGLRDDAGHAEDASENEAVIDAAFTLLVQHEIDMTIFFRTLAAATTVDALRDRVSTAKWSGRTRCVASVVLIATRPWSMRSTNAALRSERTTHERR